VNENIKKLSDTELDEIINGSVDGVYPTSQEVSMATELKTHRDILATEEPDYIRYSCGCCGYESLSPFSVCLTCNFDNIEETPLFMHPEPPIPDEVPKGWKLVPTTATPAMARAGGKGESIFWKTAGIVPM
jgi:hypothetical protein